MTTFGKRLRTERKRIGLTQAAMAAACGVRSNAHMAYEKGVRTPRADYLREAVKLGVDCSYVLTGQRTPEEGVPLSGDESKLLQSMMTLHPDDRAALTHILRSICEAITQKPE